MAIIEQAAPGQLAFTCPGCDRAHFVRVNEQGTNTPQTWGWNKSFDKPTFTPSILTSHWTGVRCHSFVTDGRIQFLDDCTHALRNQTVDLSHWRGLWSENEV